MKKILFIGLIVIILHSCASQAELTGGKKDETPPKPILYSQKDSSINFTAKSLTIEFDENVKLNNAAQQIFISPPIPVDLSPKVTGKKLSIKLDSLQLNTTYTIFFREGLGDLNEGNVMENFTYTFSTGNFIDTLSIKGKCLSAYSKEANESYLVALYNPEDLNDIKFSKKKPRYITYTNKEGEFNVSGLRNEAYSVVAFNDQNRDYYWQNIEEIGFLSQSISPSDSFLNQILTSKENTERVAVDYTASHNGKVAFSFSQAISGATFKPFNKDLKFWSKQSLNHDSFVLFTPMVEKEIAGVLITNSNQIDTFRITIPEKTGKEDDKASLTSFQISKSYFQDTFKLITNEPIVDYKPKSFRLVRDSTDTLLIKYEMGGMLENEIRMVAPISEVEGIYILDVDSGSIKTSGEAWNNQLTSTLTAADFEMMGIVLTDSSNLNLGGQLIIELLTEKDIVLRRKILKPKAGNSLQFRKLKPGKYKLRLIADGNANGIWDPVEMISQTQPEKVKTLGTYQILKGWEADLIEIDLLNFN